MKPEPLIVTVAPGKADEGLSDEIAGTGFAICIANGAESCTCVVAVAGLRTTTLAAPVTVPTGTVAVKVVAEVAVVGIGWPFNRIVDPVPKFVPVTVIAWPATTGFGDTEEIVGGSGVI